MTLVFDRRPNIHTTIIITSSNQRLAIRGWTPLRAAGRHRLSPPITTTTNTTPPAISTLSRRPPLQSGGRRIRRVVHLQIWPAQRGIGPKRVRPQPLSVGLTTLLQKRLAWTKFWKVYWL